MFSFIKELIRNVKKLFLNEVRSDTFGKVTYIDVAKENVPDRLQGGILYVIHGGGKPKWLKFICPCSCGQEISLNLMKSYSPNWSIKEETDGTITVSPSVNIIDGCRSHFFIRRNKIDWCS